MTIQDKNVAIAEMLGAKVETYYHNHTTGFVMKQAVGDIVEKLREYSCMPTGKGITNGIDITQLKFHSDANWQFEALKYIISLNDERSYNEYVITSESCGIYNRHLKTGEVFISVIKHGKDSIFEALYQFSQYLKEKK